MGIFDKSADSRISALKAELDNLITDRAKAIDAHRLLTIRRDETHALIGRDDAARDADRESAQAEIADRLYAEPTASLAGGLLAKLKGIGRAAPADVATARAMLPSIIAALARKSDDIERLEGEVKAAEIAWRIAMRDNSRTTIEAWATVAARDILEPAFANERALDELGVFPGESVVAMVRLKGFGPDGRINHGVPIFPAPLIDLPAALTRAKASLA